MTEPAPETPRPASATRSLPSLALPTTLWRHLGLATTVPFLLLFTALSATLLLLFALRLGELAPAAAFGLGDLIPLFGYGLPHLSLMTIPVTFLAGVLLAYGQFSADGSYVAARCAGFGPLRLAAPALVMGGLLTVLIFTLTLWAEPWGNRGLKRELVRLAKVGVVAGLRPGAFNQVLQDITVYVERVEQNGELHHLVLHDRRDPQRGVVAFARKGRVRAENQRDRLLLDLDDGELQTLRPDGRLFRRVTFGSYRFDLDVAGLLGKRVAFAGATQDLNVSQLRQAVIDVRKMGHPTWRWELALHRKFALPWAPILFALLGVALGLGRVQAPRIRASLIALGLVAVYYTLLRTGDSLAARGQAPIELAAWLPNLALLPVGLWLFWRRMRETG